MKDEVRRGDELVLGREPAGGSTGRRQDPVRPDRHRRQPRSAAPSSNRYTANAVKRWVWM